MACWAAGLLALVMLPPMLLHPHFTAPAEAGTECTAPPQVKNTQPFTQETFPSGVGTQLRYKCGKGYKRKAGTSNLIVCQSIDKTASWSTAKVECIHPSLPSQPITSLPATPETKKDQKLPSETSTTPGSYPGSRSTSEADKNLGSPQIDTSTLPPRTPPASPKSTSTLIPLQDSPSVTTVLPECRPTVTASAKTTPIDQRETSTAEDTSRNSGFSSEKHRMMLAGVGVPAGVIIISVIVVFIIRKGRRQQQAPGPDTEDSSIRMTPFPTTPTTGGESSSFLGEHNREHEKDGT